MLWPHQSNSSIEGLSIDILSSESSVSVFSLLRRDVLTLFTVEKALSQSAVAIGITATAHAN